MDYSYVDKFNILQTLETNIRQKILMGSIKDHPEELVIINILHNRDTSRENIGKLKKACKTLQHIEKLDQSIVIVTKTQEGIPLEAYLEEEKVTTESRLSMVFQYLKNIKRYDVLEHSLQSILINESQIVIQKGKLACNELIVAEENFINIDSFKEIQNKVGKIAKKILSYAEEDDAYKKYISPDLVKFVEELRMGKKEYKNLEEIYDTFKGLYLYNDHQKNKGMSLKHNSDRIGKKLSRTKRNKSKSKKKIFKFAIGLILMGGIIFGMINWMQQSVAKKYVVHIPTAYFEKIQMKNQWQFINKSKDLEAIKQFAWEVRKGNKTIESKGTKDLIVDFEETGEYDIALKVQDNNNQWSKEYIEKIKITKARDNQEIEEIITIPSHEKLEDLNIVYEDENIIKDYDVFRNGEYAIKIGNTKEQQSSITIKDLDLKGPNFLSMWLLADDMKPIKIKIETYKNENIRRAKSVVYHPGNANTWDLMNIDEDMDQVDQVKIILLNDQATVWIDGIEFASYK
ncbi:MAG: hypothetical protein N4A64_13270 [Marinisporobacter sp.]|jgi:hypothetical protein|nr:hypothetical protein [Marinisporobacter sp.]